MAVKPAVKKEELLHREACGNCRFWERLPDAEQQPGEDVAGECCQARPSVVGIDEDGAFIQATVITPRRRRACGEYKPEIH